MQCRAWVAWMAGGVWIENEQGPSLALQAAAGWRAGAGAKGCGVGVAYEAERVDRKGEVVTSARVVLDKRLVWAGFRAGVGQRVPCGFDTIEREQKGAEARAGRGALGGASNRHPTA